MRVKDFAPQLCRSFRTFLQVSSCWRSSSSMDCCSCWACGNFKRKQWGKTGVNTKVTKVHPKVTEGFLGSVTSVLTPAVLFDDPRLMLTQDKGIGHARDVVTHHALWPLSFELLLIARWKFFRMRHPVAKQL